MRRAIYEDDVIKLLDKGWKSGIYPVASNIHALPSAQPIITDDQAIEHLQETGWMQNHDKQMYEMGVREQLADGSNSYDALLPSAQSEIVRCKDCKHKPSGDGVNHRITFPDERCPCQCDDYWYSWLPDDDWFCGNAERREDG